MNAAKGNAHVLVIVGVFLLLILMVMSGFSSCGILFSGGTQVSGQTMYSAEDRDIRGAEQDYKKLEKELDKKIKRTPTDHPGYNEYQYHLDPIEHDPWQLTSFLTTLYDDYTRSGGAGQIEGDLQKAVQADHMGRGADPVYDCVGHDSRRNPSPHAGALRVPHLPHQAGEPWLGSGHSGRTE